MRIVREESTPQAKICPPLRPLLPDSLLHQWAAQAGYRGRTRVFSLVSSFWLCLWKQLRPRSAREAEDYLAALAAVPPRGPRDGKDFCQARARLPRALFEQALQHLAEQAQDATARWRGLRLWITDGTTAPVPRTDANLAHFGRATNQHGASRFPVLRLVLLVSEGLIAGLALGPYAAGEFSLFLQLLSRLPAQGVLLADACYASYLNLALILRRGSHVIASRRGKRRLRVTRRLGPGEYLEAWPCPRPVHCSHPELYPLLPASLTVRVIRRVIHRPGYRDFSMVVLTTLLDPRQYPADEVVRLYWRRWDIELDLRTLKGTHGLDRLTARRPETVASEVYAAALAFSALRALLARTGKDPRRLSHRRARELLEGAILRMAEAPVTALPRLFAQLLVLMGDARLDDRPRLPQPRAIVLKIRRYPYLIQSRAKWRAHVHGVA